MANNILDKFENIKHRFDEVGQLITDPEIIKDMKRYVKLNQEYKSLEKLLNAFKEYKSMVDNIQSGKEILAEESDEELREMAREEIEIAEERIPEMEKRIKMLLVPADPEDSKNAFDKLDTEELREAYVARAQTL